LNSKRNQIESLRCRPKDVQHVLTRLNQLQTNVDTVRSSIHRQEEQIVKCLTHVQIAQGYIEQLQPWIERSEHYIQQRLQQTGVANVNEAKQLVDQHKVCRYFVVHDSIVMYH
jgi:DNA repair exonuclease SbcCD ATPase subunit